MAIKIHTGKRRYLLLIWMLSGDCSKLKCHIHVCCICRPYFLRGFIFKPEFLLSQQNCDHSYSIIFANCYNPNLIHLHIKQEFSSMTSCIGYYRWTGSTFSWSLYLHIHLFRLKLPVLPAHHERTIIIFSFVFSSSSSPSSSSSSSSPFS